MASGLIAPLLGLLYQIGQREDSASTTGGALARLAWVVNKQDAFKDKTPYIAKSTNTVRDSWVDVVNITGSGYLTSVAAGAYDTDNVTIGFRIVIDGVEKFAAGSPAENQVFQLTSSYDRVTSGFTFPTLNMRFKTSLRVQRIVGCASSVSNVCAVAVYQLD